MQSGAALIDSMYSGVILGKFRVLEDAERRGIRVSIAREFDECHLAVTRCSVMSDEMGNGLWLKL